MRTISTLIVLMMMLSSQFAQEPIRVASIKSDETVLYGKFIFRMKAIVGSGWSSGLMLYKPNSELPEVPREQMMLQVLGKNNGTMVASEVITDDASGNPVVEPSTYSFSSSLASDYHTYTLEWNPVSILWYVDSILVRQKTTGTIDSLDSPMSIFIGAGTSCVTQRDGSRDLSSLPQQLYVDWMEYHSYEHGKFEFAWHDSFSEFDINRWTAANWGTKCDAENEPKNIAITDGVLVLSITDPNEYNKPSGVSSSDEHLEVIVVPSAREIRINLSEDGYHEVQLVNIQGKLILNETQYGESITVPYADLKAGIYLIRVRSGNSVHTRKVFIRD